MPRRNFIWLLIVAATAAVSVLLARIPRNSPGSSAGEFVDVDATYDLIRENYYGELDPSAMRRSAVEGLIARLDPFSSYVPAGQVETFDHRVMGRHRGTGIRLPDLGDAHSSKAPVETLWPYDGEDVSSDSADQIARRLGGPVGSEITLVVRTTGQEPRTVTLTRREFPLETVTGFWRTDGVHWQTMIDPASRVAYLRVSEFARGTAEKLRSELTRLEAPAGLVLDLRGNPGGLLEEAIQAANVFLPDGTIVTIRQKRGPRRTHLARDHGTWLDVPVVVLTDAETASAAEIVAGSLGLHARAVLVGERTRGKGCIQSMFSLPGDLGQLNLTTGEFLLGEGVPVSPRDEDDPGGVEPHVPLPASAHNAERLADLRERARALWREEPGSTTQSASDPATRPGEAFAERLLSVDVALARAVEILGDPTQYAVEIRRARTRAEAQLQTLKDDPNSPLYGDQE